MLTLMLPCGETMGDPRALRTSAPGPDEMTRFPDWKKSVGILDIIPLEVSRNEWDAPYVGPASGMCQCRRNAFSAAKNGRGRFADADLSI